jgi:hypothetical protein
MDNTAPSNSSSAGQQQAWQPHKQTTQCGALHMLLAVDVSRCSVSTSPPNIAAAASLHSSCRTLARTRPSCSKVKWKPKSCSHNLLTLTSSTAAAPTGCSSQLSAHTHHTPRSQRPTARQSLKNSALLLLLRPSVFHHTCDQLQRLLQLPESGTQCKAAAAAPAAGWGQAARAGPLLPLLLLSPGWGRRWCPPR